ncbi:MAG: adenylyl-sulfate kinase, partial [Myxococcota bacterium]
GKSTLTEALVAKLEERGRTLTILDGDEIRTHLSKGLSFSREDRDVNVLRVAYVAQQVVRHGGVAIAAVISPYAQTRAQAREMIGDFIEVFVDAPLPVVESRDVKGLYRKARAGEIKGFTGIDDPYEAPESPDVHLRTDQMSVAECVDAVFGKLQSMGYL